MSDDYTMELRLCNDEGMVDDSPVEPGMASGFDILNIFKTPENQYSGPSFVCTGSMHGGGEHVRCTSSAHA